MKLKRKSAPNMANKKYNLASVFLLLLLCSFAAIQNNGSVADAFSTAPFIPVSRHGNLVSHQSHHQQNRVYSSLYPPSLHITRTTTRLYLSEKPEEEKIGFLDFMNPFRAPTAIPEEYRDEIMKAEANTQAAQDRSVRIALYVFLALAGVAVAGFNGFLTNVRLDLVEKYGSEWTLEQDKTFGWTTGNPVFGFLFTNGIGGGLAFLTGGLSLVLAEMEVRTGKENAVKIWKEIQRRKEAAGGGTVKKNKKQQKKKRRSGKEAKRLAALSEVIVEETKEEPVANAEASVVEPETKVEEQKDEQEGGLIGKMKDLYKKADDMAAAQALLLNKELEDKGIIDKITDESGLKVIGKEAAAKLTEEKKAEKEEDSAKK